MSVNVVHGANGGDFDVVGARIEAVRHSLAEVFNIPADAVAFVNGQQVDGTYTLRENDILEFCVLRGRKGINRLFTEADVRCLYTGWPGQTLDDLFRSLPSESISGKRMWQERAVDDWLAQRQPDDGRDRVLPGGRVRLGGQVYDGFSGEQWRLLEVVLSTNHHAVKEDKAMEHVWGDDDGKENALKQLIKRINKQLEPQCQHTVHRSDGEVIISKPSKPK